MSMYSTCTQLILLDSVQPHLYNKSSYVLLWQSMSVPLQSKENILHRFTFPPIVGMCLNECISYLHSDIDILSLPKCKGMSWLQTCQVLNLSELQLWIYMILYAWTPRRTGLIFNFECITLYINFTTFAVKYFFTRIRFMYGRP